MIERTPTPSQAEIDRAMARARKLHARAFGDVFTWLADVLRRHARMIRSASGTVVSAGMARLRLNLEMDNVPAVDPNRPCLSG